MSQSPETAGARAGESSERIPFQTEIRQILDLVIHSLYTHREIFLRELVSNASDAIDKRRYEALTRHELAPRGDYAIAITPDKAARTLTVEDNGIGMSRDELVANIGTIARSGSKEFLAQLKEKGGASVPELIGQFGVGFYSAFMVADRVTVVTRRAGEDEGWRWESEGDGTYLIEPAEREECGTTITLHLKAIENDDADYAEEWRIREIVRKYSDYIEHPIKLGDEVLNSRKALWTRPAKEITKAEHDEFYRHLSRDWEAPAKVIHFNAEGLMEYVALLYIPSHAPFDLFLPERRHGIHLYVKRVFIMDDCKELMPEYLRFVKGLVDSADLPLNVSRETIQHSRPIGQMRSRLVKKVLDTLTEMKTKEPDDYAAFWKNFGKVLKEGIMSDDEHREKLRDLLLVETTADSEKLVSLAEYRARMPEDQPALYYLVGESRAALAGSPHLEALKARGYEVILLTDPIDEFAFDRITEFDGKPVKDAGKGDLELDETTKKAAEEGKERFKSLLEYLDDQLEDLIGEAQISTRLTESAACLVTREGAVAAHIEKLLRQNGQPLPSAKRVLEINPGHPLIERMQAMFDADRNDPRLADYAQLLYGQAALTEGVPLPDPAKFARLVADLMK